MEITAVEQKDPRFKNLEKKIGIFVCLVLVMLLAIFFFMGRERGIFTKKYTLFLTVDSGSGFIEGLPVKLLGFRIGRVKALSLTSDAKVRVALEINKEYQRWIRKGSVAKMLKEGFIGDTVVEVSVGPPSDQILEDGGELAFEKVGGVEDLAKEIKPILQEIKEITSYINNPEGDIKKTVANIGMLSEGLLVTKDTLDETVKGIKDTAEIATSAFTKINDISRKTSPVVDKAMTITSDTEKALKKLPEILDKTNRVIDDIKKLSDILSKKSHDIEDILEDTEDVLNDTKEIVKGAKDSWPISSMLPAKKELKLIPLDSSARQER